MCEKRPKYGENGFKMAKIGSTWDLNRSKKVKNIKMESKWSQNRSKYIKMEQNRLKMAQNRTKEVKWATTGQNGSKW